MAYSRSPPRSPSTQEDWLIRGPQSAKTYSTSSSRSMSQASRSQSLASASSRAYNSANYESAAQNYYKELKLYLTDLLLQEAKEGPHPNRVAARQKLTRLSNHQFYELAMDVYDEVVRRNKNDKFLPFLAVKEQFHPKRNQARQKLATLPVPRFQDLASDVHHEITRRYPSVAEAEDSYPPIPQIPPNTTQLQPSKPTNIIPVKGMISVESVDKFSDDECTSYNDNKHNNISRSPISPADSSKDYFSRSSTAEKSFSNAETEKIKSDYEYQINIMTGRIKQLQDDLAERDEQKNARSMKSDQDSESLLRFKKKEADDQKIISQMEGQYKKLDDKYQQLNREYNQQQEAVQAVKKETKQMLVDLKKLAKINEDLLSEKEKTDAHILKLQDELRDWQMKFDKARIELRSIKASSVTEYDQNKNMINENFLQPTKDGLISQDHIFTYQASIDDLLSIARSSNPSQTINIMKNIVSVCRFITEDVESRESTMFAETKSSLYDLKTQFSTALSDLLVAAKYHASGMGISPVSLLDRSAGHLTSVIVDLVKLLGMHTSVNSNSNDRQPIANSYFKRTDSVSKDSYYGGSRSSPNHKNSVSTTSSQFNEDKTSPRSQLDFIGDKLTNDNRQSNKQQQRHRQRDELTPEELVKYLKTETDNIVQTIQNLLGALRLPQQNGEVYAIISTIVKIVATISELSKATCQTSEGYPYRNECEPTLAQLSKCSQRLSMIQSKYFSMGAIATADAKRNLAKEAYEIAKFTKELINLFEYEG